jgi:catechol 2,3-dioxygenase-like lactoylglutathione lyase family enzyme
MQISHMFIPCRDQDEARDFYVDVLGFERNTDVPLGDDGTRWLTVNQPGSELEVILMPAKSGLDPEVAKRAAEVLALGGWSGGVMTTDDCRRDYEQLKAKGVEFTEEPTERFYGTDCGFRDPSGVSWRLTQPAEVPAAT